jgi:hypothetical protein
MRRFGEALTGANCTVGGQSIISLNVTEDVDADYATAAATCLAPGGAHVRGTVVETIEGGVSTGHWVVDEVVDLESGDRTWRKKAGDSTYKHLPIKSYKLRRKGYMQCRSTISKSMTGSSRFPPKFTTEDHYRYAIYPDIQARHDAGEIDTFQAAAEAKTWIRVPGAQGLINHIANWGGLNVSYQCGLPGCAEEYFPVSKTIVAAVKEIAAWSGASCYLDRSGVLQVFDWRSVYSTNRAAKAPTAITSYEGKSATYPINQCTVVGKGYRGTAIYWKALPAAYIQHRLISYSRPAREASISYSGRNATPVEYTEGVATGGDPVVEERIEINEYPINPLIAQSIVRDRLSRAVLTNNTATVKGPAEGSQGIYPLHDKVLTVQRTLTWTGKYYKYTIEMVAPSVAMPSWSGTANNNGWW